MREYLLAWHRQSGQKQDLSPALFNHNMMRRQLLSRYRDFAKSVRPFLIG
jgi:hypothetical protein